MPARENQIVVCCSDETIRLDGLLEKTVKVSPRVFISCSELHVATLPASQQEEARQGWTKILRPFKCREPWLCPLRG